MILFYSDPHLGLTPQANTTPASRQLWQDSIYAAVNQLPFHQYPTSFCLGDFFDKYHNYELDLVKSARPFKYTSYILSGNHDIQNKMNTYSSLYFLNHIYKEDKAIFAPFNESFIRTIIINKTAFYAIPYLHSQKLFIEALEKVEKQRLEGDRNLLLLHCNYDLSEEIRNETTLNLSKEWAERLKKKFDYVLMGHIHEAWQQDNLICIGNTFPTSFNDINQKRFLLYNTETNEFSSVPLRSPKYLEVDANHLDILEDNSVHYELIKVIGDIKISDVARIVKEIKKIWEKHEDMLGIKLDFNIEGVNDNVEVKSIEDLPTIVNNELKNTELYPLWKSLLGA
jgi:DNA repair exonuclease SbcCD nuclease subunit